MSHCVASDRFVGDTFRKCLRYGGPLDYRMGPDVKFRQGTPPDTDTDGGDDGGGGGARAHEPV